MVRYQSRSARYRSEHIEFLDVLALKPDVAERLRSLGRHEGTEHRREDNRICVGDLLPANAIDKGGRVFTLVDDPDAGDLSLLEFGGGCVCRNGDVDTPHFVVDADFAIANPEEALFAPVRAPAVLGGPAAFSVIVTDDADAMSTETLARDVMVDAAAIMHKVVVDDEAADQWPILAEPGLHLLGGSQRLPAGDLFYAALPIGAGRARLVSGEVGEARLVDDADRLVGVERLIGPPAV